LFKTEVSPRFQLHDIQTLLEQFDERQEQGAVETFAVKLRRFYIGRRHHHDATVEQAREEAPKNHCVSDVGNVKFIETQDPRVSGNVIRREADGVTLGDFAELQSVAIDPQAVVNIEHERVKVHPSFALDRACGEKKVHQHRLPAADFAPNVDPFK